jgi:hypothetical protein
MQGCCPHRESSLLPRKIAAGILGTKSFQEMLFCAFGIGTTAPANGSFAIATILPETLSSKAAARAPIQDWTGVRSQVAYGGSSFGQPFGLLWLGQRRQFEKATIIRGRTRLIKCRSEKLAEPVTKSRRTRSLGSELRRIARLRARASMKSAGSLRRNIRPPADYVLIPQSASRALSKS